jgi:plastocyanin
MRMCLPTILLLALLGAATNHSVDIKQMQFTPSSLKIKAGDSVTWTNSDDRDHSVTGSGISSGKISPGGTFSYTFKKAGTYTYTCSYHPRMKGTVTVE